MTKSDLVLDENDYALILDELEDALLHIGYRHGQRPVAVYSIDLMIDEIILIHGISRIEAELFIAREYLNQDFGEDGPVFIREII